MARSAYVAKMTLVVLGAALVFSLVSCGKKDEQPQMQVQSKEVIGLVDYYQKMKALAMTGKVEKFREMRDSLTQAIVDKYIAKIQGRVDSERVSMWGKNWPNVVGLPLVEDSSNGEWRRLTFTIIGAKDYDGKDKVVFPVVLFRKNGSQWKVSNASQMGGDKVDKNGHPILLKDMIYPEMFKIPPDFSELFK